MYLLNACCMPCVFYLGVCVCVFPFYRIIINMRTIEISFIKTSARLTFHTSSCSSGSRPPSHCPRPPPLPPSPQPPSPADARFPAADGLSVLWCGNTTFQEAAGHSEATWGSREASTCMCLRAFRVGLNLPPGISRHADRQRA